MSLVLSETRSFEPPRFAGPDDQPTVSADCVDSAEDVVLADMDTFTDWLGGECMHKRAEVPILPRDVGALQLVIDRATVPMLTAMLIGYRSDVRAMAGCELRQRYLDAQKGYILRVADSMAWGEQA